MATSTDWDTMVQDQPWRHMALNASSWAWLNKASRLKWWLHKLASHGSSVAQPLKTALQKAVTWLPPTVRYRSWPLNGDNFPWLASTSSWLLLTWRALVSGLVASSKATLWDNLVVPAPRDTMELPLSWQSCQPSIKPPLLDGWHRKAVRILPHFMLMGTFGPSFTWMMLATKPASMAGFAQKWHCLETCSVCGIHATDLVFWWKYVSLFPHMFYWVVQTRTHALQGRDDNV